MKRHNHKPAAPNKAEQEFDTIVLPFCTLVFTDAETAIGSVLQFQTIPIEIFMPGGTFGVEHVKTYFVAMDDFQPERLTNIMRADLERLKDNPQEAQKLWFERFSNEIITSVFGFAAQKHGGLVRVYDDIETKGELDILFSNALLESTPTDFDITFNSRRRNGRNMLSISMKMSDGLAFISQPLEPGFSAQGDFDWEVAQGEYLYKGKKYHFQLSFERAYVFENMHFNKESFQLSLRKTLNAAIKDVTGQSNSIEKLELY